MRLDVFLVQKRMAPSRTQAQELIKNGHVFLCEGEKKTPLIKPNIEVLPQHEELIRVDQNVLQKYVSRGGLKLEGALQHVQLNPAGLNVLDVGQSTGGFTDCLRQFQAQQIVGVDVGRDQLHESLRKVPNIHFFESLHVNNLAQNAEFVKTVPHGGFDLAVADVSFISLTKVMPHVKEFLKKGGRYLFLVKPQFEAGPNALDKNGIVKDEKVYAIVQNKISDEAKRIFGDVSDYFKSELVGKDGNQEFFIYGKNQL